MFESDDYDEILSQMDIPELCDSNSLFHQPNTGKNQQGKNPVDQNMLEANLFLLNSNKKDGMSSLAGPSNIENYSKSNKDIYNITKNTVLNNSNSIILKPTKRNYVNSYCDYKSKRKFPGPAGLLLSSSEEKKKDFCHLELFSQDIDFTQSHLNDNVFETPLWEQLIADTKNLRDINTIMAIKQLALAGNLQRKKARYVAAIVESIDRSAIDPLITLRDKTGNIKGTIHRDAWAAFSTYLISDFCAIVLCKPTVLLTGRPLRKLYLNIILSNISVIYSSATVSDGELIPDGYQKICEECSTTIKAVRSENITTNTVQDLDIMSELDSAYFDKMV